MSDHVTIQEQIALSKAIGDAAIAKARAELPSGKRWKIDFTVRIVGELSRDPAISDQTALVTEQLAVDPDIVFQKVLKSLGLSRQQYDEEWKTIENRERKAVARRQAKVKPHTVIKKGREGDIRITAEVIKLDGSTKQLKALRTA